MKGSFIVAVTAGLDPLEVARDIAADHGGTASVVFDKVIGGFEFRGPDEAADDLALDPRVRAVNPNYVVRTMHAFNSGYPDFLAQTAATTAKTAGFTGAGVRVAVLDTGVRFSNPALSANNGGSVGVTKPTTSGGPCSFPTGADDLNGHGTRSAGNALGLHGVAAEAKAVSVKVFPGSGSSTDWVYVSCGLNYVRDVNTNADPSDNIAVVNMSLAGSYGSGSCTDGSMRQAVCEVAANALIFAAAGNNGGGVLAPASFPEVVAVSGFDTRSNTNTLWSSSARGSKIAIGAPAVSICSPSISQGTDCSADTFNETTTNGTSRSSPMAAGAAAVLLAAGTPKADVLGALQKGGTCPNGTTNGVVGPCVGKGSWSGDSDGIAEPFLNVKAAVDASPNISLAFVNPLNNQTVDGAETIQIQASQPGTLADDLDVDVRIGGAAAQETTYNAPYYELPWTTPGTDGPVVLEAIATDPLSRSRTVSVTAIVDNINDPPTVSWINPSSSTVGTSFEVRVAASDDRGVSSVTLFINDGSGYDAGQSLPVSSTPGQYAKTLSGLTAGAQYTLRVDVTDTNGVTEDSSEKTVTIANAIYQQDFDQDADDPDDLSSWIISYGSSAGSGSSMVRWHRTNACGAGDVNYGHYYGQLDNSPCNYSNSYSNYGYLYSPTFTNLPPNYKLSVRSKRKVESCTDCTRDQTTIDVTYNGGSTWTRIYYRDARNASTGTYETLSPENGLPSFNLGSSSGRVRFRFRFSSGSSSNNGYFGWAIDTFKLLYP